MRGLARIYSGWLLVTAIAVPLPALADDATPLRLAEVLSGKFTQERQLAGLAAPIRSEGRFVLAPDRGLIWRVELPFSITTVMTRDGIVQFNGETEMVKLSAAQAPLLARLYEVMGGALTGNVTSLEDQFHVARSTEREGWRLKLTPRDPDTADALRIQSIEIVGDTFIESVEIAKDGGDMDRLTFHDQEIGDGDVDPQDAALLDRVGQP